MFRRPGDHFGPSTIYIPEFVLSPCFTLLTMAKKNRHPIDRKMHISQKLAEAEQAGKPVFSFEFFPPKTDQVRQDVFCSACPAYSRLGGPELIRS